MAYNVHLYSYVGSPRRTNAHSNFVATVKVLGSPKRLREGNGLDDLGEYALTIQAPKNIPIERLKQALADTFSTHGCYHEWDCCGCACNHAWSHKLRKIRRGQYVLPVSYGRNF